MSATQVIIHFVGLCLFSASVPNDPGVHAILPAVTSGWHQHAARADEAVPSPGIAARPEGSGIEDHVSMIVFPTHIIDDDAQWKAGPIPDAIKALSGYSQVTLQGEHVTFLAGGVNPPAVIPGNMPRFTCPKPAFKRPPPLVAAYQWPYPGAQAVVDIPEGKLAACHPGDIALTRVDTKLTLNTTGKLTIVGMKQGVAKTLTLNTDQAPRIYVINVPARWAAGDHSDEAKGVKHYVAYYLMIGKNKNSGCSGAPKIASGQPAPESCAGAQFLPPGPDDNPTTRRTMLVSLAATGKPSGPSPAAGPTDKIIELMMANSECSNSAWP